MSLNSCGCTSCVTFYTCREDGIFIEDAAQVPSMVLVAEGFAGHPEEQYTNPDKQFNIRCDIGSY
jgi:hypothetical protein